MGQRHRVFGISGVLAVAPFIATMAVMAGLITNIRTRVSNATQTTFFLTMVMGSALYMAVQYLRYIQSTYMMEKADSEAIDARKGFKKKQLALVQVFEPSSSINADFFRMSAIFANHRRTRESIERHIRRLETFSDECSAADGTAAETNSVVAGADADLEVNVPIPLSEGPASSPTREYHHTPCHSLFMENYARDLHIDVSRSPSLMSDDDFTAEYSDTSVPTSPEDSYESHFETPLRATPGSAKFCASSSPAGCSPIRYSPTVLPLPSFPHTRPSRRMSWSLKNIMSGFISPTPPSSPFETANFKGLRPLKLVMKEHRKSL